MDARIAVIGAGYVGLITASCFAELGHRVICVEANLEKLLRLKKGLCTIYEPGLSELLSRNLESGRLVFTDAYDAAIPAAEFVFIAVNTPPRGDGEADTSFVFAATNSILQNARPGLIIITKSTVPVGTGDEIEKLVRRSGIKNIHVVSNPEFLREGSAVKDFMQPDRIVIGANNKTAGSAVAGLYDRIGARVIICRRRSAELAKYAANALLATRISFMNEISNICNAVRADIHEVELALGTDRRIGPAFLKAGIGWGGSCFPKDLRALASTARQHGYKAALTETAIDVNTYQRKVAIEFLKSGIDGFPDTCIGVLGLAFKPNTDDTRESPALAVIAHLLEQGIKVRAHDPMAMDNARQIVPHIQFCENPYEVADGCDALLLATEWQEYLSLDWGRIRSLMRGNTVLDGRNVLDIDSLTSLGFRYLSFGRHLSNGDEAHSECVDGRTDAEVRA
jgi:UDPglucose 6-dehydrogenase